MDYSCILDKKKKKINEPYDTVVEHLILALYIRFYFYLNDSPGSCIDLQAGWWYVSSTGVTDRVSRKLTRIAYITESH